MFKLDYKAPCTYLLPKQGPMRVPGLVIASEKLLEQEGMEEPLRQVHNVATLQGIIGHSIAMPDMHWGYGFPIGGVAAMDAKEGVISPGGVGYDINCGVRLATIKRPFSEFSESSKSKLINRLFTLIPSGVGHGHQGQALLDSDYRQLFQKGARWAIEQGFGNAHDLDFMENYGVIGGSDFSAVSAVAKERGKRQLGSIGSGNHFVEIGEIEKIFFPQVASEWGIEKGETYVLIHSGSRGLGHQVCQDTLEKYIREGYAKDLIDRQLVAASINSPQGQEYFAAMAAAANYAFNNRQKILHQVRIAFSEVCDLPLEQVKLLYDVCHNIAKFEDHLVNGQMKKLCVHRKGATRAFGPGHPELSPLFQKTGQPVIVPGDMKRASHLLVGSGNPLTWCSCCHGAGRARSRAQSMKVWGGKNLEEKLAKEGISIRASSERTIAEEMPDAYKDVDDVVDAVEEAKLAKKVARLKPSLVIKG